MSALPRITQRVILRPDFDNREIDSYGGWYASNEQRLIQYWDALESFGDTSDYQDYIEFCMAQFDIQSEWEFEAREQERRERERMREPTRSWDEMAADDAGMSTRGPP